MKPFLLKKVGVLIIMLLFFGGGTNVAPANTATHTVTIIVEPVSAIATYGDVTLHITTAKRNGEDLYLEEDDSSSTLWWITLETNKKITAKTDLGSPRFKLQVAAEEITGTYGNSYLVIFNTTEPQDFITGISRTIGHCTLHYTASATVEQGKGTDTHHITYTITST